MKSIDLQLQPYTHPTALKYGDLVLIEHLPKTVKGPHLPATLQAFLGVGEKALIFTTPDCYIALSQNDDQNFAGVTLCIPAPIEGSFGYRFRRVGTLQDPDFEVIPVANMPKVDESGFIRPSPFHRSARDQIRINLGHSITPFDKAESILDQIFPKPSKAKPRKGKPKGRRKISKEFR